MTPDSELPCAGVLTDLYQLTMAQAYVEEGMNELATFSLFVRRLPARRNYVLACGLDHALAYLERFRFDAASLEYLASLGVFSDRFLTYLGGQRFTGSVRAVAEGTPVFAGEPLLEVVAPLPEAQLVESMVMNEVHLQTVLASKAARVVHAAGGRDVIDFGLRRMHGAGASLKAARAFWIAGVAATSNVAAGQRYGIPLAGTMAHSYIQAHDDEMQAFRRFTDLYPRTTLLVDTYDTPAAIRRVIALARERGAAFAVQALRLDSGDLAVLARQARRLLDAAGLSRVRIIASGGLDEDAIAALVAAQAPIDGFGVGTDMGVSRDAPALDIAYKLTEYAGVDRVKLSPGKAVLPGRKQVFRCEAAGTAQQDVIARADEQLPGRPLLHEVMRDGERLPAGCVQLAAARRHAADELARLPARVRAFLPPIRPTRSSPARRCCARAMQSRIASRASEPSQPRPGRLTRCGATAPDAAFLPCRNRHGMSSRAAPSRLDGSEPARRR